ncbi:hypothetical protein BH23ACT5_BH23ACT5_15920 [soil metagenome]
MTTGDSGDVAVIVHAARPAEVSAMLVDAYRLTPRQREVLGLLLLGRSVTQITHPTRHLRTHRQRPPQGRIPPRGRLEPIPARRPAPSGPIRPPHPCRRPTQPLRRIPRCMRKPVRARTPSSPRRGPDGRAARWDPRTRSCRQRSCHGRCRPRDPGLRCGVSVGGSWWPGPAGPWIETRGGHHVRAAVYDWFYRIWAPWDGAGVRPDLIDLLVRGDSGRNATHVETRVASVSTAQSPERRRYWPNGGHRRAGRDSVAASPCRGRVGEESVIAGPTHTSRTMSPVVGQYRLEIDEEQKPPNHLRRRSDRCRMAGVDRGEYRLQPGEVDKGDVGEVEDDGG